MMLITSALFLIASIAASYAILFSVSENIDRIYEVIEQRDGSQKSPRKITIGEMRFAVNKSAIAAPVKLHSSNVILHRPVMTQVPQNSTHIALYDLPLAA